MIRTRIRVAAAAAFAAAALLPWGAVADTTPAYFPETSLVDSTAYTLRIAGADRYSTAGTLARVAAVNAGTQGGYPFEEPDRNEPAKAYGFASCPKTVAIAAGDTVADALAASPAKDVAALTVGGTTVDMTKAVLLVTQSAREGANDLSPQVLATLQDLRSASCTFDAVIFGGPVSVSANAQTTLDSIAGTVVRLDGATRFATAARIATGLGAAPPTVTVHEDAATSAEKTGAVILAEAFTGADALAVGPFAAANNVPVLLASGAELQTETRNALLELQPDTLIVLGGPLALEQPLVDAAAEASGGAEIIRIGGENRYETSVLVAQQLFGIFEGAAAEDHSNLGIGFARSEGAAGEHKGFPDALAAAYFLDTFNDSATAPHRLAPPVELNNTSEDTEGNEVHVMIGGLDAPAPAPLLLTQQAEVPAEVADYLASLWPDSGEIKTADNPDGANDGGFGLLFGGEAAISDAAEATLAGALSGGGYDAATATDLAPTLDLGKVFYTSADLTASASEAAGGVDADGAVASGDKVCVTRAGMVGTRWLTLYDDSASRDAVLLGAQAVDYEDADEAAYSAGESRFQCVAATGVTAADVLGLSLSGHPTTATSLDWGAGARLLRTVTPGEDPSVNTVQGDDVTEEANPLSGDTTSTHLYEGTMTVTAGDTTFNDTAFRLEITFTRTDSGELSLDGGPDSITFEAKFEFTGADGPDVTFESITGESATTVSPLRLVGMYTSGASRGAFVASVTGSGTTFELSDLVLDGII